LPPGLGTFGNLSPLQEISESELDDSAISVSDFMRCTEKEKKGWWLGDVGTLARNHGYIYNDI